MSNLQLYIKYKTVKTSKFSCFEKLKTVIVQHFCLTNYLNDFSNIKTQMIHFLLINKLTNYSPSCTRLVEFTASEQFRVCVMYVIDIKNYITLTFQHIRVKDPTLNKHPHAFPPSSIPFFFFPSPVTTEPKKERQNVSLSSDIIT